MIRFQLDRKTVIHIVELTVVISAWLVGVRLVLAAGNAVGVAIPPMPMIPHAYLLFAFVLLLIGWLKLRGEKLSEFGLANPKRWLLRIAQGFLLLFITIAFDAVVKPLIDPIVSQLTGTRTTLAEEHFAALKGNLPLTLYLVPFAWLFGGFGEEFVHRGFIMTRIGQIFGETRLAWILAVLLQALPFALGHTYQGPVGMVGIYLGAVIMGGIIVLWGRNLWPAIIAHGLQDTLGFMLMYYGVIHA